MAAEEEDTHRRRQTLVEDDRLIGIMYILKGGIDAIDIVSDCTGTDTFPGQIEGLTRQNTVFADVKGLRSSSKFGLVKTASSLWILLPFLSVISQER